MSYIAITWYCEQANQDDSDTFWQHKGKPRFRKKWLNTIVKDWRVK